MELVKKNLVSIICGVIALVAVVLYFFPVSGWYTDFHAQLQERVTEGSRADKALQMHFDLPVITGEKPEPLPKFPNDAIISQGREQMAGVHAKAGEALAYVIDLNRQGHELLVPAALPDKPQNGVALNKFKDEYLRVTTPSDKPTTRPAGAADAPGVHQNLMDDILHAVAPPTQEEINAAKFKLWAEKYEPQVIEVKKDMGPGQPPQVTKPNQRDVALQFLKDTATFDEDFRRKRATEFKVYMTADALSGSPAMNTTDTTTPSTDDVWYAQMNLWVQQDICRAIRDLNLNPKDPKKAYHPKDNPDVPGIARSRVKHVLQIGVSPGFAMYVAAPAVPGATPAAGGQVGPVSVAEADPKMYTIPGGVTGRVCNNMYDVVHSTVTVVCGESSVPSLVRAIQNNRLVNVLSIDNVVKVDNAAARDLGYDYGTEPVVRATLSLEHLFMRGWTADVAGAPMPQGVKTLLGVQAPTTPAEVPASPRTPVATR